MAIPENINGIPVVDISAFGADSGADAAAREETARDFAAKCRANGCVGLAGHGVGAATLAAMFALARRLFDLPLADKMRAPHPPGNTPHRGYSGIGRERGAAKTASELATSTSSGADREARRLLEYAATTDYKESYEIGSDDNQVQYNIWLPEHILPGFRADTLAFYRDMTRLADRILDCIALALGLDGADAGALRALHSGRDDQLRLLHYPPVPPLDDTGRQSAGHESNASRMGAHTDWSLFTLLFEQANSCGGLEFLDKAKDEFMFATPTSDVVYLNVGDMLTRISNGYFPSALHRVTTASASAATVARSQSSTVPARYSIPFFVCPSGDGLIAPSETLVRRHGRSNYDPVTFNSYADQMFSLINVK